MPVLMTTMRSDLPSLKNEIAILHRNYAWPGEFFPYQLEGIFALLTHEALLLADDMGLGKTIQMIAALRIMLNRGMIRHALIIVPSGLVRQWRRELRAWSPEIHVSTVSGAPSDRSWMWRVPAQIFLTSYDTFRQDFSFHRQGMLSERLWDAVVLDEAQKIKNRDTAICAKCMQIYRKRVYALTGTPLENHIGELHTILSFLAPYYPEKPRLSVHGSMRAAPLETYLTDIHETRQLRRKKHDVLTQLPPKNHHDVYLELPQRQRNAYTKAWKKGVMELRNRPRILITHILALILRLKQICNACPETGQSAKFSDLEMRITQLTAAGHRAIVFSQFSDEHFGCHAIARTLKQFRPLVYTGALTPGMKEDVIKRFRTHPEHKILLLSLRAGGLGLNLQEANYVFHVDRWWNPAVENQAEDRSHRMGQRLPVHVFRYLIADSIEEHINDILIEKRALFKSVVDDVSLDMKHLFTKEELLKILEIDI